MQQLSTLHNEQHPKAPLITNPVLLPKLWLPRDLRPIGDKLWKQYKEQHPMEAYKDPTKPLVLKKWQSIQQVRWLVCHKVKIDPRETLKPSLNCTITQ